LTRLKRDDVSGIASALANYDAELVGKTGCTLKEIAAKAVGWQRSKLYDKRPEQHRQVAVIPMTCGQGIIEGFVESVACIITHLGFKAFITKSRDAGGVAEAAQSGAEILFMADDDRFVAVNLRTGKVSDNGDATGKGYVAGLECMCGGLEGKKVLVIGAGPVGNSAALALVQFGAEVAVYDLNLSSSQRLSRKLEKIGYCVTIETDLESALEKHCILVDACPTDDLILLRHITEDTMMAAPGIPLGVQAAGVGQLSKRLLHDPLQIGVATMMFDVL